MLEKTFGTKKEGKIYQKRIGVYGIGIDENGKIPIIRVLRGNDEYSYALLGGGIEDNENHDACIVRECLEEAGLQVLPKTCVCKGNCYHHSFNRKHYLYSIGYFYYIEIQNIIAKPIEVDHELVWMTVDEAKEKLSLPHQSWAVEEIYKEGYKNESE